ncbi:hypothetical protein [Actinoallomurus sp. CA-142502]|uniref:hypothetical protein n=1 Tax=Actinoallomurus sp. CA-142502 TaxID=3239885 RepID=UPI003D8EEA33
MRIMVGGDDAPLADRMAELGGSYGAEVTATAGGFSALMRAAGRERPNVVVTTVGPSYADHGKIGTALNLRRGDPAAGVVLLSQFVEVSYTEDLVAVGGVSDICRRGVSTGPRTSSSRSAGSPRVGSALTRK